MLVQAMMTKQGHELQYGSISNVLESMRNAKQGKKKSKLRTLFIIILKKIKQGYCSVKSISLDYLLEVGLWKALLDVLSI